jgi:uncharacterized protein (TIGR02466 family)
VELFPLFATPVVKFKFHRSFTSEELAAAVKLSENVTSNIGNATTVNHNVLDMTEFADLRSFIEESINTYFDSIICPSGNITPYITLSWMNYTNKGQHHHKHSHVNSIVSGVFYINVDPNQDKIYFYNDRHQAIHLTPKTYNNYNSQTWWLPVANNELILFPSELPHGVEKVTGDTTRISLAFNVFVKGDLGRSEDLTWLHLS